MDLSWLFVGNGSGYILVEACQGLDGLLLIVPGFGSIKENRLDDGFVKVAGG
jgi:hypothetical protein